MYSLVSFLEGHTGNHSLSKFWWNCSSIWYHPDLRSLECYFFFSFWKYLGFLFYAWHSEILWYAFECVFFSHWVLGTLWLLNVEIQIFQFQEVSLSLPFLCFLCSLFSRLDLFGCWATCLDPFILSFFLLFSVSRPFYFTIREVFQLFLQNFHWTFYFFFFFLIVKGSFFFSDSSFFFYSKVEQGGWWGRLHCSWYKLSTNPPVFQLLLAQRPSKVCDASGFGALLGPWCGLRCFLSAALITGSSPALLREHKHFPPSF